MKTPKLTCDHCGEVIGVYEPIVVIVDGEAYETSRAAGEATVARPGLRYHRDCYVERSQAAPLLARQRRGG